MAKGKKKSAEEICDIFIITDWDYACFYTHLLYVNISLYIYEYHF